LTYRTYGIMKNLSKLPASAFVTGVVVAFHQSRGFGFVSSEGRPNLFFNVSNCLEPVSAGQSVKFLLCPSSKGSSGYVAVGLRLAKRVGVEVRDSLVGADEATERFSLRAKGQGE